jgi:3-methyladenine DNA glycosylase AlkC
MDEYMKYLAELLPEKDSLKLVKNEAALPLIKEWLNSDCANVRRAVSEGLRVWTSRPYFKDNPQIAIQLLSSHREDKSEYVRKSVGNAL